MSAVYDYEPQPHQDPMVTVVDDFIKTSLSAIASEKALLLQLFPFCKYLKMEPKSRLPYSISISEKCCVYLDGSPVYLGLAAKRNCHTR